jgi:hypothetical protein
VSDVLYIYPREELEKKIRYLNFIGGRLYSYAEIIDTCLSQLTKLLRENLGSDTRRVKESILWYKWRVIAFGIAFKEIIKHVIKMDENYEKYDAKCMQNQEASPEGVVFIKETMKPVAICVYHGNVWFEECQKTP